MRERPHVARVPILGALVSEESARRMHHGTLWVRSRGRPVRCELCGELVEADPYGGALDDLIFESE